MVLRSLRFVSLGLPHVVEELLICNVPLLLPWDIIFWIVNDDIVDLPADSVVVGRMDIERGLLGADIRLAVHLQVVAHEVLS